MRNGPSLNESAGTDGARACLYDPFLIHLGLMSACTSLGYGSAGTVESKRKSVRNCLRGDVVLVGKSRVNIKVGVNGLAVQRGCLINFRNGNDVLGYVRYFVPVRAVCPILRVALLFFRDFLA